MVSAKPFFSFAETGRRNGEPCFQRVVSAKPLHQFRRN
ncbi:hypothetical protein LINPERHAP2_LOCUS31797 [Linum perenne]